MTLWFVFAMMTAAAIFAVLWPLGRGMRAAAGGRDTEVYKDQLDEVARDAASGLIAPADAAAARVEIARRLLASDDKVIPPPRISVAARRAVAVAALIGLPLIAASVYLPLGAPQLPDQPLASRSVAPSGTDSLERLIAQVETHLDRNPTDGRGWSVLAPVLLKVGRADDAVRAFRNSITYSGETSDRRADLGEAVVAVANGVVTADAKTEFDRAVALDARSPKARYFLGLAAEQDGRPKDAATIWRALLSEAPANAPWREGLQEALARVDGPDGAPVLSDDVMASAAGMADGDRTAMIRSMVERLATRIKSDGGGADEWLRLVRAYMVLGDRDKARAARGEARQALAGNSSALQQFDERVRALGLDG